jgi:hypothetical protein
MMKNPISLRPLTEAEIDTVAGGAALIGFPTLTAALAISTHGPEGPVHVFIPGEPIRVFIPSDPIFPVMTALFGGTRTTASF